MNRSPSLCVPLPAPWHVCSPSHWGVSQGGRRQDAAETSITLSHFTMESFVLCLHNSQKRAQKETEHANKHTPSASKQYHQFFQASFSCFYRESPVATFLFQSHYDSVGTVIFLCCGFQGPKITFSLASLKFIVNINRPKQAATCRALQRNSISTAHLFMC